MNTEQIEIIQGKKIQILKMVLTNDGDQLKLSLKLYCNNVLFRINFHNVSRFRMGNISMPLEVEGFEIINHSQDYWETDSRYEIRDFEDDRVNFFCESFEIMDS